MALEIDQFILRDMIGHDGSKILWPALPEPQRRRAFHVQEMTEPAFSVGKLICEIEEQPVFAPYYGEAVSEVKMPESRFSDWLARSIGVIGCATKQNQRHAVAWDGNLIFDPAGTVLTLESMPYKPFILWVLIDL